VSFTLTLPTNLAPLDEDRFWSGFETVDGGCWEWTKNTNGIISFHGESLSARSWAYKIVCGDIPRRHYLERTCVNPRCINPAHQQLVSRLTLIERIKAKIEMPDGTDCWIWTGPLSGSGTAVEDDYPHPVVNVKRILYEDRRERLPLRVRFFLIPTCNTPRCVNPWHMEAKRTWNA
jgi:hypothetical protein